MNYSVIELTFNNNLFLLDEIIIITKINKYFYNHYLFKNIINNLFKDIVSCNDILINYEKNFNYKNVISNIITYQNEYWNTIFYYNFNYNIKLKTINNYFNPYQLAFYYSFFISNYKYKKDYFYRNYYFNLFKKHNNQNLIIDSDSDSDSDSETKNENENENESYEQNNDINWLESNGKNGYNYINSKWSCIAYPNGFIKHISLHNKNLPKYTYTYDNHVKIIFNSQYKKIYVTKKLCELCSIKYNKNNIKKHKYIMTYIDIKYIYNYKHNIDQKINIHKTFLKYCYNYYENFNKPIVKNKNIFIDECGYCI